MPELPEAEVARRDLEREVAGLKIKSADVPGRGVLLHHRTKADFAKRLVGAKVKSFDRRGNVIVGKLDTDDFIVIDLGATGRLRRLRTGKLPAGLPIAASIVFTQKGSVHLIDPAATRSGAKDAPSHVFVATKEDLLEAPEFADLGMDPLETPVPWQQFGLTLRRYPRSKLKAIMQNQEVVAGLGYVYTDEILFRASLRPDRLPESLSAHEVRRLYRAMVETLVDAVKARGVSLDETDVDMFGEPGKFASDLAVHGRSGERCVRCRGTVEKIRFQKKSAYFCPGCQS
jgi:formamidopyrimidine-DNA glycosylase